MAVKKGILDNFLKPSSHSLYSDNQKNFRSIFIDKSEDDLKPDPQNFLESSLIANDPASPPSFNKPELVEYKTEHKPTTNWQQSDNKPATNRQQSDNKPATNRQQTSNKPATSKEDIDNKVTTNWQQSDNETGNNIGNKVTTNRQQTDNKVATMVGFSELVGLQRDIIIFMSQECKNSRSRITEALTLEYIAKSLKRNTGAVKTTIQRLEKKDCLHRVEFKNGRGGWSRYEVPDRIYHHALRNETGNKLATNWQQTDNKVASQPATEPATNASSSSSSNNIKTTTTTNISGEWNFDVTPYVRFGFSPSHIRQLASRNIISAGDVEQSLIEFSFDLDNGTLPQIKTSKLNFLMGLFSSGQSYVSEGFKTEQEIAISEMARRNRVRRENAIKAKFEAWEGGLSDEDRKKIEDKMETHLIVKYRAYGISSAEVREWMINYYLQSS